MRINKAMPSSTLTFKDQMTKASELAAVALRQEYLISGYEIGAWNKVKLRKALAVINDFDLANRTLLTESVHADHAERMTKKFIAKADSFKRSLKAGIKDKDGKIRQRCRFLTLVHSMEVLDVELTLEVIKKFKETIEAAIHQSKGIWCAGSIEIEVVSLDLMQKVQTENGVSEKRKFEVCQLLAKHLSKSEKSQTSHFLVHFHGVAFASNADRFEKFESTLKNFKVNNKRIWAKAPRQIQLKPISEQFAGKKKSLNANLKDIARYITKGGNDWFAGKAYLQYKLAFENTEVQSEDAWIQKNWRRNEILRQEKIEDGLESILSLNKAEVICLAKTIDSMMELSPKRLGYLVQASSSPKKASLYAVSPAVQVSKLPI